MNPGKLDKKVTFRVPVIQVVDSLENVVFVDGATVWASFQPLRGREFWQAQQVQNEGIFKVVMRYVPNVKDDWKIRYEGIEYEITSIIDINMQHNWLEIYCKVVV